jgi:hypothetical protein
MTGNTAYRMRVAVRPRLAGLTIREVSIRAANSDVQYKVKLLVERSIVALTLPRVVQGRVVPPTPLPEAFRDDHLPGTYTLSQQAQSRKRRSYIQHDLRWVVNVRHNVGFVPNQAVNVEVFR